MNFLITNDDGVEAKGIKILERVLKKFGDCVVCAPLHEMSATSHKITLKKPLVVKELSSTRFGVEGSPADCVYLGLNHILKKIGLKKDNILVFSGINHGPNLGFDTIYSGTVAGATEALVHDTSGIAVSFCGDIENCDEGVFVSKLEKFMAYLFERIALLKPPFCLNINLPGSFCEEVSDFPEVEVTRPGKRIYNPRVKYSRNSDGSHVYFLGSSEIVSENGEGTDSTAVAEGKISITPLKITFEDEKMFMFLRNSKIFLMEEKDERAYKKINKGHS